MFTKPPQDKELHPDLVSITQEMVDIYPKGHSDGKVRIKFYKLLRKRSEMIQSLMERGECDSEGLVSAEPEPKSNYRGVYDSFMSVLGDEEEAVCYTIDLVWEAGKSPLPFKQAALESMRQVKRGKFPKLSVRDKTLLQTVLLDGNPQDNLDAVCEQVYQASKAHQSQKN